MARIAFGLCLIAGLLAYHRTFSVPLLLDDIESVAGNASIRSLWPPGPVLSPPANVGLGGRPVANLSFALNYALSGLDLRSYHAVNLAIHLGAALALFGIVRRTLARPALRPRVPAGLTAPLALVAALLWLLHPLQTEAVTYLSQRTECLMGLFFLLTLYCFIRGATEATQPWFSLCVMACVLGMATKEVMVTAPLILLLYDRTFVAGSFREAWRLRRATHLALAATWLVLVYLLSDVTERGVGYAAVTWWQYALTECRAVLHYLRLAFYPAPLVFDYGAEVVRHAGEVGPHLLAIAAIVGATLVALWRFPIVGFAGAWFLVLLAPTSSVVPVAGQPLAEHRMYLPLAGIIVFTLLALQRWLGRWTLAVGAVLVLGAGGATLSRNRDYRSAIALWSDTVTKAPKNGRARAALGAALLQAGDLQSAMRELDLALRLDPQIAEAHNNLATALSDAGRNDEAIAHYAEALRLRPGTASTHYNFGNALLQAGRVPEAIARQQQALALKPQFPEAECALGDALAASGKWDEAVTRYRRSLQGRPDLVPAHFGLANALTQLGRLPEAIQHFEVTVRGAPGVFAAHFNLANALVQSGRAGEAVLEYELALQLNPNVAEAHHNLANTLAFLGNLDQAIAHYVAALKLRPEFTEARANLEKLRALRGGTMNR